MRKYLVGIDDTDNKDSRGTGFLARSLASCIREEKLGITGGITRHQLLFDSRVPYTSQNSSACIEVTTENPDGLWVFMIDFLLKSCASGSDCGLCMIEISKISPSVIEWGFRVKTELVGQAQAHEVAQKNELKLIGLTGNHDGIIGALAGVGLRASGNDGRFVSLSGVDIRTIEGVHSVKSLKEMIQIHQAITKEGHLIDDGARICLEGGWLRPVLKNGLITIIANNITTNGNNIYQLTDKEYIKSISN